MVLLVMKPFQNLSTKPLGLYLDGLITTTRSFDVLVTVFPLQRLIVRNHPSGFVWSRADIALYAPSPKLHYSAERFLCLRPPARNELAASNARQLACVVVERDAFGAGQ